jgi:hypothetical protein
VAGRQLSLRGGLPTRNRVSVSGLHFDNCIVGNEIAKVANRPARVGLVTNVTQINKFLASVESVATPKRQNTRITWICEANVGQATKGTRGIPWHQQPKKDVVDHERPGRAVNRR